MARRHKGEGSIRPVKNREGKVIGYRGRIRKNGHDLTGPVTRKRSDALRLLYEKIGLLAEAEETGPTLSSCLAMALRNRLRNEWAPGTYELGETVLRSVLQSPLADLALNEVEEADILKWRDGIRKEDGEPPAGSTLHRYQRILEKLLSAAGRRVTAQKPRVRLPTIRILSKAEQAEFVERAVQPRTKLVILLLLNGLRAGEVCGLKHEDRDGEGVWVQRQGESARLKTDDSWGWVPLLFPELLEQIGPPRSGYVAATANKTPMAVNNLRRMVQSVADGTTFSGVTPQQIRHTAAVNLLRAGVRPTVVASITRHSLQTLERIYDRVEVADKTAAAEQMRKWMEG